MLALKEYRQKNGIKQAELAKKIGVANSTISMWETGDRKPDIIILKKLAEIFGCTTDELLEPIETNFEELVSSQTTTAERTDENE